MQKLLLLIGAILLLWACESPEGLYVVEIPTPVGEGGEPNLFSSSNGDLYLSWVEYLNDSTDALNYARLQGDSWAAPKEIARGMDWFVNWADFPSLAIFPDAGSMAAHWLQKSAGGTYDYDVRVTISKDAGDNWSPSFIPHTDGIPAEHGFVTLLPTSNDRMFATWLDGRNTKASEEAESDHGHGHGGAMTLRAAEFDIEGQLFEEVELDHRICDCCQTDAVMTSNGPIVVYRDRSAEEIRDIYIVRKIDSTWTEPQPVASDNWEIAGCPVNGPAAAAKGDLLAVAWFSGANKENHVKVALSQNAGASFTEGFIIDDGQPIGRVDIVLNKEGEALVSWIEEVEGEGEIRIATVNEQGKQGESKTLMKTGISRQSGFPILEKHEDSYVLAWTSGEEKTTVRTVRFEL
ncbi:MAG: exo-alpha-sialidase [Cyanothece sp. SIO1E1]|nr:exo-alpha-sialidase [Cyanothece sp. SIO1E1]